MSVQANAGQVEKVLEDLIIKLTRSASTAEVRAALIEAKRLRNVTTRWAAIPPPPDARREMMTRVMDLIAQVGVSLSKPPPPDDADREKKEKKDETSVPPVSPKASGPGAFKPTERAMESVRGRELPKTAPPAAPPRRPRPSVPDSEGPPTLTPFEARSRGLTPPPLPAMVARGLTPTPRSGPSASGDRLPPPQGRSTPSLEPSPMTPRSRADETSPPPSPLRAGQPLRGRKLSDAPRSNPPPNPFDSPFRGRTKTGIADDPEEVARVARSRMPTAPPPASPGFAARRETKVMGSQSVEDAIDALGEYEPLPPLSKPPPKKNDVEIETFPPPSPRQLAGTLNLPREGKVEGFSSTLSLPSMRPVKGKKPSNPTMQLPTPIPEPIRGASSQPPIRESSPGKPLRTVVSPGVTIVRPEAAQWQAHPSVPGVTLKLLFRDPRTGVYTALLRLAPGATFPRRRHAASEEVLVISGLANIGSFELRAGEYCRAESESVHDPITTATGCTLFVCGSEHDEFLDDP
jgi:hypothetical protein